MIIVLFQSEDIRMLRQEIELGIRNLEKVAQLRDECASLGWKKEEFNGRCSRQVAISFKVLPQNRMHESMEYSALIFKKQTLVGDLFSRDHILSMRDRDSAVPPLNPNELYRPDSRMLIERPQSAPGYRISPQPPRGSVRPSTAQDYRITSSRVSIQSPQQRPYSARPTSGRLTQSALSGRPATASKYKLFSSLKSCEMNL